VISRIIINSSLLRYIRDTYNNKQQKLKPKNALSSSWKKVGTESSESRELKKLEELEIVKLFIQNADHRLRKLQLRRVIGPEY